MFSTRKPQILASVLVRLRHTKKHCPRTSTKDETIRNNKILIWPQNFQDHIHITECSGTSLIYRSTTTQPRVPKGSTASLQDTLEVLWSRPSGSEYFWPHKRDQHKIRQVVIMYACNIKNELYQIDFGVKLHWGLFILSLFMLPKGQIMSITWCIFLNKQTLNVKSWETQLCQNKLP